MRTQRSTHNSALRGAASRGAVRAGKVVGFALALSLGACGTGGTLRTGPSYPGVMAGQSSTRIATSGGRAAHSSPAVMAQRSSTAKAEAERAELPEASHVGVLAGRTSTRSNHL